MKAFTSKGIRLLSVVLTAAALSATWALPARGQAASKRSAGRLELSDCPLPNSERMARCGTYTVWEDRESRSGRIIALNLVVLPATYESPAPDPVFFLAGGPGQGAAGLAQVAGSLLPGINGRRDIVLLDQRGTGRSNGLHCSWGELNQILQGLAFEMTAMGLTACLDTLDADVRLYTTPVAMDDLDDVRAALGYEKINVFGGSYGTRAALVYTRRHPEHVRTLVLRGVASTDMRLPLSFARDAQTAMDSLVEACAEERVCGVAYPELRQDLDALLTRLDQTPARVRTTDPRTQERAELVIDDAVFAGGIRLALYGSQLAATIPLAIEAGLQDDFQPFLQAVLPLTFQIVQNFSIGMFLSVVCTEDVPYYSEDEARRSAENTFLGPEAALRMKEACALWPRGELPEDYRDGVEAQVPALLISGAADPVTPPGGAEAVGLGLPNALHLVLPETGHVPSMPGCVAGLVARFIEVGTLESGDTSCVNELRRPPFVVPDDG